MLEFLANVREREETLAGSSSASQRLREQVERIAHTPRTTVLLLGRSLQDFGGVARAIHARSPHTTGDGPFVDVHSSIVGARGRAGTTSSLSDLLRRARDGTLFLQAVHELAGDVQEELLEHLNESAGGSPSDHGGSPLFRGTSLRVLASTSVDLERCVATGDFRPDLFYRLNVLAIRLPTLRERAPDLEALSQAILRRLRFRLGVECLLTPEAGEALAAHLWAGDLFELELALTRAAFSADGAPIRPEHLLLSPGTPQEGAAQDVDALIPFRPASRSLRDSEEALIRRVLTEEGGNRSSAARVLGINRTTLYNKLRQYGIT